MKSLLQAEQGPFCVLDVRYVLLESQEIKLGYVCGFVIMEKKNFYDYPQKYPLGRKKPLLKPFSP